MKLTGRLMACLFVTLWSVPLLPAMPRGTLDSNWMLALSAACQRGLAFGSELVFTFGPYGCLVNHQYWPSQYLTALIFCFLVALIAAWLALSSCRNGPEFWAATLILLWLGATARMMPDAAMIALPLAYVLHALRNPDRRLDTLLGLIALGFVSLTKFTLLPICLLAAGAAPFLRPGKSLTAASKAFATELPLFIALLLLAWCLAGQALIDLPYFLAGAAEVARGYPQAMAWGPHDFLRSATAMLASVSAAALALTVAAWAWMDPGPWWRRLVLVGFVLLLLYAGFRHGVIRADEWHLTMSTSITGALALVLLLNLDRYRVYLGVIATACLLLSIAMARTASFAEAPFTSLANNLRYLASPQASMTALSEQWQQFADAQKEDHPHLRTLSGSYDIIGHDQHLILAAGLEAWRPRPIFQSYSAYTPRLAAANADFLSSPGRPEWLIVAAETIDGRLPTMDDAALWPEIKRLYVPQFVDGRHLVMSRRVAPELPVYANSPARVRVTGWSTVPGGEATPDPSVYAAIDIHEGLRTRLRAALWRPPLYFLELRAGGSGPRRFRIVPEAAQGGFLLWPVIDSPEALRTWTEGRSDAPPPGLELRVVDEAGRPQEVELRFVTRPLAIR